VEKYSTIVEGIDLCQAGEDFVSTREILAIAFRELNHLDFRN
jgi:hypothetical protein